MNQASKVAHSLAQKIAQLELQNTVLVVEIEELKENMDKLKTETCELKELNQALTEENEKLKGGD